MKNINATAKMRIKRPASEVFEAFADPSKMTKFWFPKSTGRLEAGSEVKWYVGTEDDAPEIIVRVKAADKPNLLHIEWGSDDDFKDVKWQFKSTTSDETEVFIIESGFADDSDEAVKQALDSTCGFNQVITAAKAFLEHNVVVNVVEAHCE